LKILILKPSSLGDVVQALPVLRLLKRHWPDSEIFWWIDSNLAPLLEGDPDLAGVVRFERRRWASPRHWPEVAQSILELRRRKFDLVIDLQCLARSGAFAWLARGQQLIGLDEPREGARGFYDVAVRRASYYTHAVDWYLEVLRILGVPVHWDFEWLPRREAEALAVERRRNASRSQWVTLLPGARWPNKRWPVEHFIALVSQLGTARPDVHIAVLGGESDRELGAAIAKTAPDRCLDLTGQLNLPEMVEWIRLTSVVVSNDTGPMHVAAALRRPIVAMFGPTEPRRTGPYGQIESTLQTRLPCVPCMRAECTWAEPLECLRRISPQTVLERVVRALAVEQSRRVPA